MAEAISRYLKQHTEALVKDIGIEQACHVSGKSKATLGRYYSDHAEHSERFMPIETVAVLEQAAGYPHVTSALAELAGATLQFDDRRPNAQRAGGLTADVIALSQRFAVLMSEYHLSMQDGVMTVTEARRLMKEATQLQQVLIDMKLNLDRENGA